MNKNLRSKKVNNPDFDLDEYIEEKIDEATLNEAKKVKQETGNRRFVFFGVVVALALLVYFFPTRNVTEFITGFRDGFSGGQQIGTTVSEPVVVSGANSNNQQLVFEEFEFSGNFLDYSSAL
ncbi:MAG: hypothetical protein MI700_02455, partial [Balneolales bacterium]|nr:hypothetical protein [Balneolales bacterium]